MSVTDTNVIDIVATQENSSKVNLVIADHLSWEDFDAHTQALQDKINTYIDFVETGQLRRLDAPKIPDIHDVSITLALEHEPPKEAEHFFQQVREFLSSIGMSFDVEVRPSR